jgi:hypothetical protein
MCGYVHLFVTAQIKSRDAKDNRFKYFKVTRRLAAVNRISRFDVPSQKSALPTSLLLRD